MDRSALSAAEYHEMLLRHLVPMFAGSELERAPISCEISADMVVPESVGNLLVRPDPSWPHCFRLRRTHPFESDDIRIMKQFVRAFGEKASGFRAAVLWLPRR